MKLRHLPIILYMFFRCAFLSAQYPAYQLFANVAGVPTAVTSTLSTGAVAPGSIPAFLAKCLNGTAVVDCSFTGGGGGSSVGSAGDFQMVGSTAGSFAAAAINQNANNIIAGKAFGVTGTNPSNVTSAIVMDFFSNSGRLLIYGGNTSTPATFDMFLASSDFSVSNNIVHSDYITWQFNTNVQANSNLTVSGTTTTGALSATGSSTSATIKTATNCSSSASPAVCGSAAAGSFVIAATTTAVTVNTTAVTANSQIFVYPDESLGTKLGVTCNTTLTTAAALTAITARAAGTSFTVTTNGTVVTNPACYSYSIIN